MPLVTTPAADLGELWQTLDVLPEAETPEDLLATTIEMVAVNSRASSIPVDRVVLHKCEAIFGNGLHLQLPSASRL